LRLRARMPGAPGSSPALDRKAWQFPAGTLPPLPPQPAAGEGPLATSGGLPGRGRASFFGRVPGGACRGQTSAGGQQVDWLSQLLKTPRVLDRGPDHG